jgi:uncharacterized membrane-anchored protein YhcB (DUF1043 family)
MMVGVEWLIVAGLVALGAGWALSLLGGGRPGKGQARIRELENELAGARQELEDYKEEVVSQFSETARKFKTLDDSYAALHRQLAESSSLLCGAAPGPLLEAPAPREEPPLAAADATPDQQSIEPEAGTSTETTTGATGADAEPDAEPDAARRSQAAADATEAGPAGAAEDIVVGEAQAGTAEHTTSAESAAESPEAERTDEAEDSRKSAAAS